MKINLDNDKMINLFILNYMLNYVNIRSYYSYYLSGPMQAISCRSAASFAINII